jgi:class 3 adenylate cyclase
MTTGSRASGASTGVVGTAPQSQDIEVPDAVVQSQPLVERAFAFVDLCGFTRFTTERGEHDAIRSIQYFRALARDVSSRRGVLINKWLGDGALIVGPEISPIVAATLELVSRHREQPLDIRAGVAHGHVLVIDGDDYVGRPTNLASRLCGAARPGELLSLGLQADVLPPWSQVLGTRGISVRGIGRLPRVQVLGLAPNVRLPRRSDAERFGPPTA